MEAIKPQNVFLSTSPRKRELGVGLMSERGGSKSEGLRSTRNDCGDWGDLELHMASVEMIRQLLSNSVALNVREEDGVISCLSCSLKL